DSGHYRAISHLLARPYGHPTLAHRLAHRPKRGVLRALPGRDASCDRGRALPLFLARLVEDHPGLLPQPVRAGNPGRGYLRTPFLAHHRSHHSRWASRPSFRENLHRVLLGALSSGLLPHREWHPALRSRAPAAFTRTSSG